MRRMLRGLNEKQAEVVTYPDAASAICRVGISRNWSNQET